jgi:hypothetical protein
MSVEQSFAATALRGWNVELEKADKFFSALTDEQLQARIAPDKNRLVYLWGHLIAVHDRMLPLLGIGERMHEELDAPFLLGPDSIDHPSPSAADLKRWWHEVNARIGGALTLWTPADWIARHTAVSPEDFAANPLRNRLSVVISRTAHISYHVGQAVLVR